MKAGGAKTDNIAIVHENTEYGTSVASVITSVFKENGLSIAQDIAYSANTTDVQSQVLQLKDKKPDVVIMVSYTSDAILYAKTMQALDYKPPMMMADNAGFSDPSFIKAVGKLAQGVFNRSSFAIGPPGSPSFLINEMYKKKSGDDMDDTAARQMQGFFVLIDAIDRAKSTEPDKIQAALKATDLKPDQLIMGYKGRKVRRQGPEHPGGGTGDPVAGRRELRRGLAEEPGQDGAGAALQGLVINRTCEGGALVPPSSIGNDARSDLTRKNFKPACPPSSFR